jgi:glycosyltransferase involved in cell wall biosynthesis/tetrahydromethanopterin S-methyltransferase subunit G
MSNGEADNRSHASVDEKWYLANYPDVAASGIPPSIHYTSHGIFEGRLPRPLLSKLIEEKLWAGFSTLAQHELEIIFESPASSFDEKLYAAWSLARWHASHTRWDSAEKFAEFLVSELTQSVPRYIKNEGLYGLVIEIYLQLNNPAMIAEIIANIPTDEQKNPHLLLSHANISHNLSQPSADYETLRYINEVFNSNSIGAISKFDETLPLSLDNIKGSELKHIVTGRKISVIIPAFNAQDYIGTAIRGLLAQTWDNIEIIVVDDCSTDSTPTVVKQYSALDNRVRLIRHYENLGAYASRNTALKFVTGEFLTTHDSDDWSHPQRLELQVEPLLNDPLIQASLTHWVRTKTDLHFIKWRPDANLIHASVSTLLYRSETVLNSGGWDAVKVAADSELFERVKIFFGCNAISEVAPGVPLVLARHLPNSLTTSADTHAKSEFWGLRRDYREVYRHWHSSFRVLERMPAPRVNNIRQFPAPSSNVYKLEASKRYTVVLMADLSTEPVNCPDYRPLISRLLDEGISVAVFHWPDFCNNTAAGIAPDLLNKAICGSLHILTPGESCSTNLLLMLGNSIFKFHPDRLPKVSFEACRLLPNPFPIDSLVSEACVIQPQNNHALIKQSGLFDSEWYYAQYPDVRMARTDAILHYLNHGYLEGREPSPDFNTDVYLDAKLKYSSRQPALLHYLQTGHKFSNFPCHPTFEGLIPQRREGKNVLVCGHASDMQIFGAERSLLDILDALRMLEYNVIVTIPSTKNPDYIEELRRRSTEVLVVPSPLWTQTQIPCNWSIDRFANIIRAHSIDIVHVNTSMLREPLIAAKQLHKSSVVHIHEIPSQGDEICTAIGLSPAEISLTLASYTSMAIANSHFTASKLCGFEHIAIVNNTIDFSKLNLETSLDLQSVTICLISSNLPKKGINDFVDVARMMQDSTPIAKFLIIGPNNDFIESLRHTTTLPKNVGFLGYTKNAQEAIGMADIVLNLSQCQETFGRTVLEAMAAKRTVLAYDHGALNELIIDGHDGFLIPFRDLQAVCDRLTQLCKNPHLIREIGEQANKSALKKYNPDIIKSQIKKAYNPLLNLIK